MAKESKGDRVNQNKREPIIVLFVKDTILPNGTRKVSKLIRRN